MAYVTVPKDLSKVKSKLAFNLTGRQLLCFGVGAAVGIPFYIFTKDTLTTSVAGICMVMIMLPFFFLALYEKDGLPFEKIAMNYIHFLTSPQVHPYETNNYYRQLENLSEDSTKEDHSLENQKGKRKKKHRKG